MPTSPASGVDCLSETPRPQYFPSSPASEHVEPSLITASRLPRHHDTHHVPSSVILWELPGVSLVLDAPFNPDGVIRVALVETRSVSSWAGAWPITCSRPIPGSSVSPFHAPTLHESVRCSRTSAELPFSVAASEPPSSWADGGEAGNRDCNCNATAGWDVGPPSDHDGLLSWHPSRGFTTPPELASGHASASQAGDCPSRLAPR